ncbi:MAG TPA: TonB-dependent receptor [Puia sp.]|nr:TonB-dependent receptor [Puia sp.]
MNSHRLYRLIFYIAVAALTNPGIAHAQGASVVIVTGSIADSSHHPLEGATIVIRNITDSGIVAMTTSRSSGDFSISLSSAGNYILQISHAGYTPYSRTIHPAGNRILALGVIMLPDHYLQEAVIRARSRDYMITADKRIFTVASAIAVKGGTAVDVMKLAPAISVSPDGRLTLRNGAPVVLVDGKKTNLSLDQIPADQIERIEIITTPTARYDAQGNSGIVNIVMKQNDKPGFNGSLVSTINSRGSYSLTADVNRSQKKLNLVFGYSLQQTRTLTLNNLARHNVAGNTDVITSGETRKHGPYQKIKTGLDYKPDSLTLIDLSGEAGWGYNYNPQYQRGYYYSGAPAQDSSSYRTLTDRFWFGYYHFNAGYTRLFPGTGAKLTSLAYIERYKGGDDGRPDMMYYQRDDTHAASETRQRYYTPYVVHNYLLQMDYIHPFKKGKASLEAGWKITGHEDHTQSSFYEYQPSDGSYVSVPASSFDFLFNNPVFAVYSGFGSRHGPFSYQAGLRFEQNKYTGHRIDSVRSFTNTNPALFPSLITTLKGKHNDELHLNYSRRVNRPGYYSLAPYTDYSNPLYLQRGNPNLRPEYTNSAELSYNRTLGRSMLSATVYLRVIDHAITVITLPLSGDTLLATYVNARSNNSYGLELVGRWPATQWWDITLNINLLQSNISIADATTQASNTGFSWFGKCNWELRLGKDYALQINSAYQGPQVLSQGRKAGTGYIDVSAAKNLPAKGWNLLLTITNILNTSRDQVLTRTEGQFSQTVLNKPLTRAVKVGCTYQFGSHKPVD